MFNRIHKVEEYFENEITESALQYIEEEFDCHWSDLDNKQIAKLIEWINDNQYSVMAVGFQNVLNWWEDNTL